MCKEGAARVNAESGTTGLEWQLRKQRIFIQWLLSFPLSF